MHDRAGQGFTDTFPPSQRGASQALPFGKGGVTPCGPIDRRRSRGPRGGGLSPTTPRLDWEHSTVRLPPIKDAGH
jgi:hypothetical protein